MIITLFAMLTMAVQTTVAMSYEQARNEALFLTDKMAYELNLSDAQYEAAYEINLDYLMSVTGYNDVNGICWERRNADLRYILYSWQWDAFCAATYFFRPLYWDAGYWHFGVYARYPHRDHFYFGRPHFYASYRGGHSWRMNGGRSFYEHRRDYFRPGHVDHNHHIGMRNAFDRGDYRGATRHNSSTRVTAGERHNGGRSTDGGWRSTSGNRDNSGYRRDNGNDNHGSSSLGGGRSSSLGGGRSSSNSSTSHSSGSIGGGRSSSNSGTSHSSGSFSGGRSSNSGTSHSSGSLGGGRSSTRSSAGNSHSGSSSHSGSARSNSSRR